MKIEIVSIDKVKNNDKNPRTITDQKFKKLVQSIKDFPEMLNLRPIVVTDDYTILGGNMRFRACIQAGVKEIPIIKASNLSEKQQKEFIIKDNVNFGDWDWDFLANEWDGELLGDWGLNVPVFDTEVDYSILDEDNLESDLKEKTDGVKKGILIEFNLEHFDEARELMNFWRQKNLYFGGFLMEKLKEEKNKL